MFSWGRGGQRFALSKTSTISTKRPARTALPLHSYSNAYWSIFAGLIVLGLIGGGIAYGLVEQARYADSANDQAAYYAEHAADEKTEPCKGGALVQVTKCADGKKARRELATRDKRREYDDLVAQQRSALWAMVMGVAALIGMGLSLLGVLLVWITFRETRVANEIARKQGRPWLNLEPIQNSEIAISNDNLTISLEILTNNFGDQPAIDVFCKGFIVVGSPDGFSIPDAKNIAPNFEKDFVTIIFPSVQISIPVEVDADGDLPEKSELNLVLFCRYRIPDHTEWHATIMTYRLGQSSPYWSSGRFQNGEFNLQIAENHTEILSVCLTARSDFPPIAT